jgi:hypothetical protein
VKLTPFTLTEAVAGKLTVSSVQFTGPRVPTFTRSVRIAGGPGPSSATVPVPARLLAIPTPVIVHLTATDAGGDKVSVRGLVRLRRG